MGRKLFDVTLTFSETGENLLTINGPKGISSRVVKTEDADLLRASYEGRWQNVEGGGWVMQVDDTELNDLDLLLSKEGEEGGWATGPGPIFNNRRGGGKKKA